MKTEEPILVRGQICTKTSEALTWCYYLSFYKVSLIHICETWHRKCHRTLLSRKWRSGKQLLFFHALLVNFPCYANRIIIHRHFCTPLSYGGVCIGLVFSDCDRGTLDLPQTHTHKLTNNHFLLLSHHFFCSRDT